MSSEAPEKWCAVCGRRIEWRRKWARDRDAVKHCSARCRRARLKPVDHALERAIVSLLEQRAHGATICPSEAARLVGRDRGGDWRELMQPARSAARRLVGQGRIDILQRGRVVDGSTAKGPIRLRRR